ncbi:uncharacterized protein [Aquarana catesbeiana]|uniref:uncharacterized protein n=1 Tax=Aquarana catesbeiana TaxID=8400 RepID=UPI003CC99C72
MSWNIFSQFTQSSKKHVVGITTRAPKNSFRWFEDFIMKEIPDHIDVVHFPITNNNRRVWMETVNACSVVFLYHTKHQGRVNITDVEGALYEEELQYLNKILGREKVVILLDDMDDISEEERRRILRTQISLDRLSSHLILIPEKEKSETARRKLKEFRTALSEGVKTSQKKESPGLFSSLPSLPSPFSIFSRSLGDTGNSDSKNNGERTWHKTGLALSPPPPYQIGIFSRSAESNYTWLIRSLKVDDPRRLLDIKSVYITNDYETFRSGLETCQFAILYHTKKQGRLNITDVADSLYNEELRDMSNLLGRENVIVVADDLSSESEDKERILRHQHSIKTYAEDLFLFTEYKKYTDSLKTIKEMIRKRQAKYNGRENRKTPDQGSTSDFSSSWSDFLGPQTSFQKSDITEPQFKRSKTLWFSKNINSIGQIPDPKEYDNENGHTINNSKGERAQDTTDPIFSTKGQLPPPPYQICIFSRSSESSYKWLSDSLKEDEHMTWCDIKAVCITNDYKTFGSGLQTCRFAILYHTLKHGRLNITNVEDSLYDTELKDMSNFFGKNNVIVVADDLKSSTPEEKERILEQQPSISNYAKDLFLFTEGDKRTRNLETIKEIIQSQAQHKGPNKIHRVAPPTERELFEKNYGSSFESHKDIIAPNQVPTWGSSPSCSGARISRWESGDAEHNDTINNSKWERSRPPAAGSTSGKPSKPRQSPLPLYRIGIFSRCAESNYKWLSDSLKEDDHTRSLDIKPVYITNDYETFSSGLKTCRFAILYHTQKHGRLNITDVQNSLYDDELKEMSRALGKKNVIVVADDLKSREPEDKERILEHQPSIPTYAKDLFIFTEHEKYRKNLEKIRKIIQSSQTQHKGPNKEHHAAPPTEWEPFEKNYGSSLDSHKNIIAPNQVPTWGSSPFCSGQAKYHSPDTEHQAAPSIERESSVKTHGYFADDHKNRITSDQVSTKNSSPSCSGCVDGLITSQNSDTAEPQPKKSRTLSSERTSSMDEKCSLPEAPSPDPLSAPNKKWNDSQQENRELRKVVLSQEEKIKELENSLNLLTLEKNRAVEKMKEIIEREERNIDGHGEERENLQQQRETKEGEIGMYVLPQVGGEGAHGHEIPPQGQERFPEKGHHLKEHLQKTEGSSCLNNQNVNELLTNIRDIINEKDCKLQRKSEEIKSCQYLLSRCKCQE